VRLYRLLLRLFPRTWRERYGDEILRVLDEEKGSPRLAPSLDLMQSGLMERVRQFEHLIWSGVRFARGRTLALAAGLMVAAVGFSLLTASVDVNAARIQGVVGSHWRGAYDILVLPAGGGGSAPTSGNAVQANYLSAAAGGISLAQDREIASLPGVSIAAPLEIVGYVLETVSVRVSLTTVVGGSGAEVFTLTSSFTSDNGLSRYPSEIDSYVYVTPDPVTGLQIDQQRQVVGPVEHLPNGESIIVCPQSLGNSLPQPSPFESAPGVLNGSCDSRSDGKPIEGAVTWSFPVLIAAIDPAAEEALDGLGGAVTSGHYLAEGQGSAPVHGDLTVPVLASTVPFDGDVDDVSVDQLPGSDVTVAQSQNAARIAATFGAAAAPTVAHQTITASQAWQALLQQLAATSSAAAQPLAQIVGQYWTAGPVSYQSGPHGQLEAVPVANPESVWDSGIRIIGQSYVSAPPADADTGFRSLTEHTAASHTEHTAASQAKGVLLDEVGEFDPYRLPGFAGDGSPLATYRAPVLSGANASSRTSLGGKPLEPSGNLAGYTQEPPLLLTTLQGAQALEDPDNFLGPPAQATAPIGFIRVRVGGLRGSVTQQLAKIAAVGSEIHRVTGLHVVVTAGASAQPETIGLPAGKFGRPPLQLSASWTSVGVALVVLQQADRESLALFVLILVVCGLFLGGAALAGVRARRGEVAVLRALGWDRRQVFALVLGEVAMLGVTAGVVGAVLSLLLIEGLRLDFPAWRSALVLPVAVMLSVLAGLVPALLAARAEPVVALVPAIRAPHHRGLPVRSITGMALAGVLRTPGRCALAGVALAVGVTGLAVLLAAEASFGRSIGDSALAGLVTATTRSSDLASAVLAVCLGAAAVADVTYLNLRERAAELAALAAAGWGRAQLARLVVSEASIVAVIASACGAALGLLAAAYSFGLSGLVVAGVVGAMATGTAAALLGTGTVLAATGIRSLTPALAADE
jgi:putative ABC transport system permease protein